MQTDAKIITRYSPPTKFDHEEYGMVWRSIIHDEGSELYLQLNDDKDKPHWERVGIFMEKAFEDSIISKDVIQECLRSYKCRDDNSTKKISAPAKDHPDLF